ncbi:MAG: NUDIX hydrolase [Anaerolineales bacterium]|nr:NUDIX hydrolase [Anaerolineales bacterium]
MPARVVRYQGAIVRDHHLLLIHHKEHADGRGYWLLPGGGIETGETEEACVRREMHEETNLAVAVERLLLDAPGVPGGIYKQRRTFLCKVVGGEARPGYEPEAEAANVYAIDAVTWVDLRDPGTWGSFIQEDEATFPELLRVRAALGYPSGVAGST